ncbi:outer membrane protein assembly factor BamD [Enterobacteriaceae endosymbiont of Donacia cincticornis]|uniref:outer membrane protein assembly factor BamD n=1 Tax=Enterobacteriaceae endosymbiont of Donacia cincticornis TaxID=2675773 RepID=UPI00144962C3|nr:outer membrane protein assembly factor BamD [Enterobacteriaceae endosymbiont of Donacia cincticornis]QJC36249.1 outer membrane protein assembly factor BamD [Enterobacteriaceae endosymbiont of Donacia cincticornis]
MKNYINKKIFSISILMIILVITINCKYYTYEQNYSDIPLKCEYLNAIKFFSEKKYNQALLKFNNLYINYPHNIYTEKILVFLIYLNYLEHNFLIVLELIDEFIKLYDHSAFMSYIFYIKIITEISLDTNNLVQNLFKINRNDCNPFYTQLAINDTKIFFKKYPNSIYIHLLKKKLVYMMKRVKNFDLNIIKFLYRKKKYISTINRCLIFLKNNPDNNFDTDLIKKILNNSLNKLKINNF